MEDKYKNIWEEAEETFLEVLKIATQKQKELHNIGDLAGEELLEKEVISKYEALYLALQEENFEDFSEIQWKQFQETLTEIQKKHQMDSTVLKEKRYLRKKLEGKSGAEVVKRLLEYQQKELEKQKRVIMEEANQILEEEEKIHRKLCEAIQEVEQLQLFEQLQPLQKRYAIISEKALDIQKKIDYTVRDIEKNGNLKYMALFLNKNYKKHQKNFLRSKKTNYIQEVFLCYCLIQ